MSEGMVPTAIDEATWKEVWAKVDAVEGWLTEPEARVLFDLVLRAPRGPLVVVELGAYKGRSAVAMLESMRLRGSSDRSTLVSVDLWRETQVWESFVRNTRGYKEHSLPYARDTADSAASYVDEYPVSGGPVRLVFIDGDHSYAGARRDFEAWAPVLRDGGFVAFHDSWAPGPARVISELPGWFRFCGKFGEIAVFEKQGTS